MKPKLKAMGELRPVFDLSKLERHETHVELNGREWIYLNHYDDVIHLRMVRGWKGKEKRIQSFTLSEAMAQLRLTP